MKEQKLVPTNKKFAISRESGKEQIKAAKAYLRARGYEVLRLKEEEICVKTGWTQLVFNELTSKYEHYGLDPIKEVLVLPRDWDKLIEYTKPVNEEKSKELTFEDLEEGEVYFVDEGQCSWIKRSKRNCNYHSLLCVNYYGEEKSDFFINDYIDDQGRKITKATEEQIKQLVEAEHKAGLEWNSEQKRFDNYIESYPIVMRNKKSGTVVMFRNLKDGLVVIASRERRLGYESNVWVSANRSDIWEPVELEIKPKYK